MTGLGHREWFGYSSSNSMPILFRFVLFYASFYSELKVAFSSNQCRQLARCRNLHTPVQLELELSWRLSPRKGPLYHLHHNFEEWQLLVNTPATSVVILQTVFDGKELETAKIR